MLEMATSLKKEKEEEKKEKRRGKMRRRKTRRRIHWNPEPLLALASDSTSLE